VWGVSVCLSLQPTAAVVAMDRDQVSTAAVDSCATHAAASGSGRPIQQCNVSTGIVAMVELTWLDAHPACLAVVHMTAWHVFL
jgi:hypothetical protein